MYSHSNRMQELEREIAELKILLNSKENELKSLQQEQVISRAAVPVTSSKLLNSDIVRYSRQIIIPQVGIKGQVILKQSSVLIVGAGGLGCPASLYLAGVGVGCIGIVDYDLVEESNLHRQLLHSEDQLGKHKVTSAAIALKRLNSSMRVQEYACQLNSANALEIVKQYDVVVDASDNVATRYLVNDACVLSGRPLVSGSALQLEGQLTVYNHDGGPCYRCLYPQPPPASTVTNCSDAGVLGAVPGVIGTLQALETTKIILGMKDVMSSKLLLFDGENSSFRSINLRKKSDKCPVCSSNPTITKLIDYEAFCGSSANDKEHKVSVLNEDERIEPKQLHEALQTKSPCVVVDVRQPLEYDMCSIPNSVNIPLKSLKSNLDYLKNLVSEKVNTNISPVLLCTVCRRGNDSQLAVRQLDSLLSDYKSSLNLRDLRGGLHAWAKDVDPQFPVY